jgi:hypothetical protein
LHSTSKTGRGSDFTATSPLRIPAVVFHNTLESGFETHNHSA